MASTLTEGSHKDTARDQPTELSKGKRKQSDVADCSAATLKRARHDTLEESSSSSTGNSRQLFGNKCSASCVTPVRTPQPAIHTRPSAQVHMYTRSAEIGPQSGCPTTPSSSQCPLALPSTSTRPSLATTPQLHSKVVGTQENALKKSQPHTASPDRSGNGMLQLGHTTPQCIDEESSKRSRYMATPPRRAHVGRRVLEVATNAHWMSPAKVYMDVALNGLTGRSASPDADTFAPKCRTMLGTERYRDTRFGDEPIVVWGTPSYVDFGSPTPSETVRYTVMSDSAS